MRHLIGACKNYPDKQRTLFIMSYVQLVPELEKRKMRQEFEQVNRILKQIYKYLENFVHFKEQNLTVFALEDSITFVNKLKEIADLIK